MRASLEPSFRHRLLNLGHSIVLIAGMVLIAWTCASAFFGTSTSLFILTGLLIGLLIAPSAPKGAILSAYGARRLTFDEFPLGGAILSRLTNRAGLPRQPALYYLPTSVPNAFAVGDRGQSAIAVSDGILRLLDRREFAAVLAHEVSHIANRDLWIMALADVMSRATALLSIMGQLVLFLNIPLLFLGLVTVPWHVPIVLIFAPTVMSLLQLALSRAREFDADMGAAKLTGDPMSLAAALDKLERRTGRFWEEIFLPGRRIPEPSLLRTHPPTDQRIARLRELSAPGRRFDPEPPERIRIASAIPIVHKAPRMHWTGLWF